MLRRQQIPPCLDLRAKERAESGALPGRRQLERLLIHAYVNALSSRSWRARKKGAKGLGQLGVAASVAAEELERLLEDPDPRVREAAGDALARVSPGRGVRS
jgi:HEAT repeat protein